MNRYNPTPEESIAVVRDAIREPYAWPGGYQKTVIMEDCELMHPRCAAENWEQILEDTHEGGQWAAMGTVIIWEGPPDYCCQCNGEIPSVYGDPEQEPTE